MSVVELDIYPSDDPNGTPLVTLTDADIGSFKMRKGENELGHGVFTIRRDHASATEANLASGNYVKVRYPSIGTEPVFAFWLDEHSDVVLARGEEGEEILTRGGPGPLFILRNAAFLHEHYAPAPPASDDRGNDSAPPGYWMWAQKQYGQILKRLIEEGQSQPGFPLLEVTTDFDRGTDSNGVDWPDIIREVRFPIGSDGLAVYEAFASTGELWVRVTPDLLVSAYFLFRGIDRTSATFAAGKVRFLKGTNINTELVREGHGVEAATHALVIGTDNLYRTVVSPNYAPGTPGRWITVNREEFNDPDVLDKVGAEALVRALADQEAFEFEIPGGFDEAAGLYMPFEHFDTGDLVTIHTGTDPWDYDEYDGRVTGFRIELREASRDESAAIAAKSLAVIVEIGGATRGFGAISVQPAGCCPPPEPYDPEEVAPNNLDSTLMDFHSANAGYTTHDAVLTAANASLIGVGEWAVIIAVTGDEGATIDPLGGAWTGHPANGMAIGTSRVYLFHRPGDGNDETVAITASVSTAMEWIALRITGADAEAGTASDTGTGTTVNFGDHAILAGAHSLLIGVGAVLGDATGTAGTAGASIGTNGVAADPVTMLDAEQTHDWPSEYRDPERIIGTLPSSMQWGAMSVAFTFTGADVLPNRGDTVSNEFVATGDGVTTAFTTDFPFLPGSLVVKVDGVNVNVDIASQDGATKSFTLDFAPSGASSSAPAERITVDYTIASST